MFDLKSLQPGDVIWIDREGLATLKRCGTGEVVSRTDFCGITFPSESWNCTSSVRWFAEEVSSVFFQLDFPIAFEFGGLWNEDHKPVEEDDVGDDGSGFDYYIIIVRQR